MGKRSILMVVSTLLSVIMLCSCSAKSEVTEQPGIVQETAASSAESSQEHGTTVSGGETEVQPQLETNTSDYRKEWAAKGKEWGEDPYYFNQYNYAEEQFGTKAAEALLDGPSCEYPVVRWYCSYKVIEYLDAVDREKLRSLLEPLTRNEKEFVAGAAGLAMAVLEQSFERPDFARSGDGKKVAFTRFPEARYNDGKVLTVVKGKVAVVYNGLDAGPLKWSPNSTWLAVSSAARIWIDMNLVNVETKEAVNPQLFPFVYDHAKTHDFMVGENQRPDPYIQYEQWSPDSTKVLLSLSFTDDRYTRQRCLAVFDLTKRRIDWLLKLTPAEGDHPDFDVPQGFSWDQPDYGVRSGRIEDLSAIRKKTDPVFQRLVDAINKGDVKALKAYTDTGMADRFTDQALAAALEDYKAYFRGQGIIRFEFAGVSPFVENGVIYRAFNGDGRFKDMELVLRNGKYICIDNFLYYSDYARKLVNAFVDAVKSEDKEEIAAVLTVDDLAYPLEKVPQILQRYPAEFDLQTLEAVYTGNMTGEKGDGEFIYRIRGTRDGMDIEHEVKVIYGDGLVGFRDDWVPEVR